MSGRMIAKTAVVTASGNGLGRASARCLAEEGVRVAVIDIDADGAAETVRLIRESGGTADFWVADCAEVDSVNRTAAEISASIGPIEALVNNMGGSAGLDIAEFHLQSAEVFARVVNNCLMSAIWWSRALVPAMRDAGFGKVVSIASDAAFAGDPRMAEYSAAKAGVIGFTRSLAMEQAAFGITANAVAPGPTRTAAIDRLPAAVIDKAAADIPLGRLGTPMGIGKAVAFFISSDADFITGQTLIVGGGRALH